MDEDLIVLVVIMVVFAILWFSIGFSLATLMYCGVPLF